MTGSTILDAASVNGHMYRSIDGLTFDPSVGLNGTLFGTSFTGGGIYAWDAVTLMEQFSLEVPLGFDVNSHPDGITTDEKGHLFIANRGLNSIDEFDVANGPFAISGPNQTYFHRMTVTGIDDLAPLNGTPQNIPEPSSLGLLIIGSVLTIVLGGRLKGVVAYGKPTGRT